MEQDIEILKQNINKLQDLLSRYKFIMREIHYKVGVL